MSLFNISNAVLEHFTGLPSKKTFLKECVVPAKDDDKFNNNKCVQCWDDYTEDHPGVKILPCGHVFGRDCLKDIVDGPTGDLCPYCRAKLFRRMPTAQDILESILESIVRAILRGFLAYYNTVARLTTKIYAFVSDKSNGYSILRPMVALAFVGLAARAELFVRNYTGIYARNPTLNVGKFFNKTTVMLHLLYIGIPAAAAFLPVYLLFGTKVFKVSWFVAQLVYIISSQTALSGYPAPSQAAEGILAGGFRDESDRALLIFMAAFAIAFQQLCILALLWPSSTLGIAWTVLASVAWR